MAEALVIAGFLGLLVVLQVKDQKKIIVAAQTSWIRMGLSIALTVAILVIFWPSNLADQIKLGAFAAIILINGFLKEGLSQEGVVKLGVLNGEFGCCCRYCSRALFVPLMQAFAQSWLPWFRRVR